MISTSALNHPNIQARLFAAMRIAVNASNGIYEHCQKGKFQIAPGDNRANVYIQNKKGHNFIRVTYEKARNGQLSGFRFYAGNGECTAIVLQSLRQA